MDKHFEEQSKRYNSRFDELVRMIQEMKELHASCSTEVPRDQIGTRTILNGGIHILRPFNFTHKLEFPKFDGISARTWVKKYVKYFTLCKIPDYQQVDIVSLFNRKQLQFRNKKQVKKLKKDEAEKVA
ncbi:hypothetical protein AgCh_031934 [Apium graveolens]